MSGPVLALDLGGTHVSAGRVDLSRKTVLDSVRLALPPDAEQEELVEHILRAASDVGAGAGVIGFASPGPFDYARGVSLLEHKLQSLYGVDLRARLSGRLGVPPERITFLNDADAFVAGEWWAGAAAGQSRVVGITLGTGVGSAFLADATIVDSGPRVPPAGEIHRIAHNGAPLEDSVSRAALIARYGEGVDADEIASRARSGDARAREAYEHLARELGEALAPWLASFDATCVVVGGSIAAAWDLLEPGLWQALACNERLDTLCRARRLDDAALLGAAWHACGASGTRRVAGIRPLHELTVAEARAAQAAEGPVTLGEPELETCALDGPVEIRLHRPPASGPLPLCVWLTGGGWVLDTTAVSDPACRWLAAETPCAVAMVRYRLAPEHRFPTQLHDSVAAVRWLVGQAGHLGLDPARVAIGGTSAGGNLAAAVSLVMRKNEEAIALATQVLVYPPLLHDPAASSSGDHGEGLTRRDADWCWSHYLERPEDGSSPLASPLLADDLAGLPPALVLAAGLDPLHDEAVQYATRLERAGVPVHLVCFDGVAHGFFSLESDAGARARGLVSDRLRHAFSVASAT